MIEIRQTETFAAWFAKLRDRTAKARVLVRIDRLSLGNPGDVRPVGEGVSEMRIGYGPGYRVYFVGRGEQAVVCSRVATRAAKPVISPLRCGSHARSRTRIDD